MPPVEVRDLTKRFSSVEAVKNLSFDVQAGRVTGFLGPNGAGKSTTLRALLGLVRPTAGTATFGGLNYEQLERPSTKVGAVLEDASFHPGRTARNHLRVLAATGDHPFERVDAVLHDVGLTDAADRRVGGYSMGMRQRLGIAAALLGDPEVLILDEPTNGLDPPGIVWMRDLVQPRGGAALEPEVPRDRGARRRPGVRRRGRLARVRVRCNEYAEDEARSQRRNRRAGSL